MSGPVSTYAPQAISQGLTLSMTVATAATAATREAPIVIGGLAAIELRLTNPGATAIAMPMVIVPVPPGFRVSPASLAALTRSRKVARAEDQGSELRLYLDQLPPHRTVIFPLAWEATTVATVTQRPAQAYAYYAPETRAASAALTLTSVRASAAVIPPASRTP